VYGVRSYMMVHSDILTNTWNTMAQVCKSNHPCKVTWKNKYGDCHCKEMGVAKATLKSETAYFWIFNGSCLVQEINHDEKNNYFFDF
jgi:general stress protein 26